MRNLTTLAQGDPSERRGRDPEDLEREAEYIREQEEALAEEVAEAHERLAESVHRARRCRVGGPRWRAEERRLRRRAMRQRRRPQGEPGEAGRPGRRGALDQPDRFGRGRDRPALHGAAQEEARASGRRKVQQEYDALKAQVEGIEDGDGLDAEVEEATTAVAEAEDRLTALRAAERDAERERGAFAARKEALELGLSRKDGAGALLAATDRLSGMLGSIAVILTIEQGAETAVAAALGLAADAVAVASADTAVNAIRLLKTEDLGRAAIVVGGALYRTAPG